MKKTLCLCISIFICSFLFSLSFASNSLGQNLGEDISESKYYANVTGHDKTIYKDGEIFKTITETFNGNTHTVEEKNLSSNTQTVWVYENGLLKSVTDENFCKSFIYDENSKLQCIVISKDGQIDEIQYFLKSPADDSLIGVRRYDSLFIYSDDYVISPDKVLFSTSGFVMTDKPFVLNENNEIEVSYDDGKTNVYSTDGKLVKSVFEDRQVSYKYDEFGCVLERETSTGNEKNIDFYKNNTVFKTEHYLEDKLRDITEYGLDGYFKVQKIFRNSVHVATVWYETNSVSATKIEYLGGLL